MPPVPVNHEISPAEQLALSDQDVHLLYTIVTRSEQHPDVNKHTFRALFEEYHAVLSENGIEPQHDQICLRFLFLLGKHLRGKGLYRRFESLLLQMGIRICIDPATSVNGLSHIELNGGNEAAPKSHGLQTNGVSAPRRRRRRASFNSIYDADITHQSINRPPSRSSVSRLEGEIGSAAGPRLRRRASLSGAEDWSSSFQNQELPIANGFDDQAHGWPVDMNSLQHLARPEARAFEAHATSEYGEESVAESELSDHHIPKLPPPPELFYQPSLSNLLADASVFNSYRERRIARKLLAHWREQSKKRLEIAQSTYQIAINWDISTLLRQGFDEWRRALKFKTQEAQTERFFKHLEARAIRARNLYLMTKAFTHWAQVASDEVEKTTVARQHILSVKYFNAWREVTAVNELKIQRLIVKKPFYTWTAKIERIQRDEATADKFYSLCLISRTYWSWFFGFCYRRAPVRADIGRKKRSLISWLRSCRNHRERENEMDSRRKNILLHSVLQRWSQKARSVETNLENANEWRLDRLKRDNFTEWRVQHNLGAASAKVTSLISTRIMRFSFDMWAYKFNIEQLARNADRQRIIHNAWTTWNDKLRCRALTMRSDARIVLQTLYKWVLMERFRFMVRVRERRLKRTMLTNLMDNSSVLYTQLLRREDEVRTHRKRELAHAIIHNWRNKLAVQRERERVALAFYAPSVELEAFKHWRGRRNQHEKLEKWAKNARYFFLMTSSVKKWRAITEQTSKKRKQDAYVMIRRKVKINLVSDALSTWRSRTAHLADLEEQAAEAYRQSLLKKATELFDQWHSTTTGRLKQVSDAEVFYNRQLTFNRLSHWAASSRLYQTEEEKAARFLALHTASVALIQLKKLSLRVFQLRTDYEKADAANERVLRKHLRNMLHHWQERVGTGPAMNVNAPHLATPGPYDQQMYEEDWPNPESTLRITDLGPDTEITAQTPIPTPGYLASPSKRAARARSLYQLSTTPATPAITPFAVRLMAAKENPQSLPSRRTLYARSPLATNVRFVIDEESEPESPTEGRSLNNRKQG